MLQKCSIWKVAKVFFDEPTRPHYLIEISRKSGLAHTSVAALLNELLSAGIIKKTTEKRGKRRFPIYTADIDRQEYKASKRLHNLAAIEQSGLLDAIRNESHPKAITLFGSYSRGEDLEESDIDIFIEGRPSQTSLERYERILHRKIQAHYRSHFKDISHELKNSIINGWTLRGYLEWEK
ncbi:MAG: nucleotidyltransferase domain-containing protein [Nanoarchaeota archaeon]